jgi:predicted phosphohydrolase
MSLFVISDLHLDVLTNEKSMEIFGDKWKDYTQKIYKNWTRIITDDDVVVIPGDISWALNLENSVYDLKWIDALPGKKIIMKGNHDFWWSTLTKMKRFFEENNISTIDILHNNAIETENYILAGSRGWFVDKSVQPAKSLTADYEKILNREKIHLRMSLEEAKKMQLSSDKEILVFFHFPPIWNGFECIEIIDILKEYQIERVFFGHIHGSYNVSSYFEYDGIKFKMVSADFVDFIPQIV